MQGYDIIMLVVLLFATYRGYAKGLAWQVASLASIAISFFVAYRFRDQVAVHIEIAEPWRGLAAMLALFVGCSLLIWMVFHGMKGAIEKAKLKELDQQLGAIFGAVKGAVFCTAITLAAVCLLEPSMNQPVVDSRSGGYVARVIHNTKSMIPASVDGALSPYIKKAEARLAQRDLVGE